MGEGLEKILGEQNTLLPIAFLELGLERAKAVGRLVVEGGKDGAELGTGFLVLPLVDKFLPDGLLLEGSLDGGGERLAAFFEERSIQPMPVGSARQAALSSRSRAASTRVCRASSAHFANCGQF